MWRQTDDIQYVEGLLARFYEIGANDAGGVTRLGYTEQEDAMHSAFAQMGEELGLDILTDQVGNTFLSNTGPDRPYYLVGSHLDSVVDGGRYDGVAGVLAGLLAIRWAKRDDEKIPIRAAAFRCEESSNFGVCMIGSELITGGMGQEAGSLRGKDGRTLGEVFAQKGYSLSPRPITGMRKYIEMHIEQGRVLEEAGQRIGIVKTIAGLRRFSFYIRGKAEHSGATPMSMRSDALCAAAELILEIEKIGASHSNRQSVATVGVLNNLPNSINVIPGETQLKVDIRGVDDASLDEMERLIDRAGEEICKRRGARLIKEKISAAKPVALNVKMQDDLERIASGMGLSCRRMASGAGHDAMKFVGLCDVALVFIPCKEGISHNKVEFTGIENILEGARVIYEYLREEYAK